MGRKVEILVQQILPQFWSIVIIIGNKFVVHIASLLEFFKIVKNFSKQNRISKNKTEFCSK